MLRSIVPAVVSGCILASGRAYVRPSQDEVEAARLNEQESIRQQEQFKKTLLGGLMDTAVQAAGGALSHP